MKDCPQCDDTGVVRLFGADGLPNGARNCPDRAAPWHRPACSCDAGGEDFACPTHGADATIRGLQTAADAEAEAGDEARRETARIRAENTRLEAKVARLSADVNRLTTKGVGRSSTG